jgi:hypothetical protein
MIDENNPDSFDPGGRQPFFFGDTYGRRPAGFRPE